MKNIKLFNNLDHSGGADVSKFKYTGQEEDKESGLLYYKARYYDPAIGRFLQADSVVMPESLFGMNRYMYTFGNPIRYGDSGGNKPNKAVLGAIAGYWFAPALGISREEGLFLGGYIGSGKSNIGKDMLGASKAFDYKNFTAEHAAGGLRWGSGGLKRAADTFNLATGQDNERKTRGNIGENCAAGSASGATIGSYFGPKGAVIGAIAGCFGGILAYDIGRFGHLEEFEDGMEAAGGGVLGNSFIANRLGNNAITKFATQVKFLESVQLGLGVIGFILIARSGGRRYEKVKERKAVINFYNCTRISAYISSENPNAINLLNTYCFLNGINEIKD